MNRSATWPAEKGGLQQRHKGRTHLKKELRTPNSKLFGEIETIKNDFHTHHSRAAQHPVTKWLLRLNANVKSNIVIYIYIYK